ncbi:MAG: hypothetical protein RLZZ301_1452 [Bacteroidota bacterium]
MKQLLLGLTILCSSVVYSQDYWLQKDTVKGSAKCAATAFVANEQAYVVTGLDEFGYKRKMASYNAQQDDWDTETALGGDEGDGLERVLATSFTLQTDGQDKGYLCLGQTPTIAYMNDMWEYNPATQAWSQKANFIGAARRSAVAFVVNNLAYVGTGQSASGLHKDFYTYDATSNTWEQIADFAGSARRAAVAFSMDQFGFLGTGNDGVERNDFWMYDPQTENWIVKAAFPGAPRSGACGWAAFPVCYLGTGEDANNTFHNDLWEYNYYLNAWTQRANLPGPARKNAIAFALNGWGFIGTGYNNGLFYDDLWAYSGTAGLASQESSALVLFPNPSNAQLNLKWEGPMPQIQCTSMLGQEVPIQVTKTDQLLQFTISTLPTGTYNLAIRSEKGAHQFTFEKCSGY